MTRLLLRSLNFPGMILIALLGLVLQSSLFTTWPLYFFQPDIVLVAVIWCALRREFTEGGIFTILVAHIAEIHSSAPKGMFLLTYMEIYLLVRGAAKIFVIPNRNAVVMITLFASVVWKLSGLGLLHLLGASGNQWRHTLLFLFPGALVEGALAIWAYRLLEKFDWITFKDPQAEKALQDEAYQDLLGETEGL